MRLPAPMLTKRSQQDFPALFRQALACLLLLLVSLMALPASAQSTSTPTGILAEQGPVIRAFVSDVNSLEQRMAADADDDARLLEIRNQLDEVGRSVLSESTEFRPRLAEINARLDQIGPAPADGQNEAQQIADERAALTQEKSEINAVLGEAEQLSVRISRLVEQIAQMRRELFAGQLSRRYDISTALNADVLAEFRRETSMLTSRVNSWLNFIIRFKLESVLLALFLSLSAAAVLMFGGRRLFGRLIVADPDQAEPSYLSRLSVAFWSTLLPSLAVATFLGATYFFLQYYNVLRQDITPILVTLFNVIATVFFINRLASAAFSPNLPNWRLVPMETPAARTLYWLVWSMSVVTGADFVLTRVSTVLSSPLSVTVAKSLVATVIVGVLLILVSLVKPFRAEDGSAKAWPVLVRYLLRAIGAVTIIAAFLGYIGFARFVSQQVVITGGILATMYIGFLSARGLSDLGALRETTLGRRLLDRMKLDESAEDQVGLALSIVIYVLVLAIGIPPILLQWGFQWGDIGTWVAGVVREVRIGSISISMVGIFTGIVVFILGYFFTRWFQGWLDDSVMARGRVDAGVRNSIRTVVGYAGLAVAALIGISAAGINLSSLALVAGGLSLGIGFGLQNIVQNFVSGLILLAERPFKAGDWIVAGSVSGTVKKISVRATEIETFQRQTVILPNSELINAAVGNWTHRNKLGRVEVKINVAYGSDVRRVQALLLDVARGHPSVLRNPEPAVIFTNIADTGLEFEIRVFVADITGGLGVQNTLRMAVYEALLAEDIVIPYAPRAFYPEPPPEAEPPAEEPEPLAEATKRPRPPRGKSDAE